MLNTNFSTVTSRMLCFPFIDSVWRGECYPYTSLDPYAWLVEVSGIPFNMPSETMTASPPPGKYLPITENFSAMLFGEWTRASWGSPILEYMGKQAKFHQRLWSFFDRFGIQDAQMFAFWDEQTGVKLDRPQTYATVFRHPGNGILLVVASWPFGESAAPDEKTDVTVTLDRKFLGLPDGPLTSTDILADASVDISRPFPLIAVPPELSREKVRLLWIRGGS